MGAQACHVILIGALAQLGERLICIQEVRSSILLGSTIRLLPDASRISLSERIPITARVALGSVAQVVRAHA